jgi:ubiquinone/menaquinone biosynthesis C-methylase UbiE
MVEKLPKNGDIKSLDAGCGPGAYIQPYLNMGYDVCAIDQSKGMIEKAKQNFPEKDKNRVTLKVSGIESIPFPDEVFDLVTNVAVLMYVPDELKCVEEFNRVMKKGATLIITVDNKKDLADIIDIPMRFRGVLRRLFGQKETHKSKAIKQTEGVEPRCYSPKEMRRLVEKSGFVIDEETSVGFAPFLINHRRIFSDKIDIQLDKMLQFLRYIPGLRLTGYTYIIRCHKP